MVGVSTATPAAESPGPVVVGIDGSDAALEAARWAAKEAVHQQVPLRLVYVTTVARGSIGSDHGELVTRDRAESALWAARLAVEALDLPVQVEAAVLTGDVDCVLADESRGAALICVGSTGINRVTSRVVGSTAATLAEQAHCPVAVIRRDGKSPTLDFGFVAVVIDDRPGNDAVIDRALQEARMRGAPALVLGVWRWGQSDDSRERLIRRLDSCLHRYPDVEVEVAPTRSGVTRYLESFVGAVQLVVVGRQDAHRVVQLVGPHGPTILAHAGCSVLILRGADR